MSPRSANAPPNFEMKVLGILAYISILMVASSAEKISIDGQKVVDQVGNGQFM
jgi:hypothetical protein